jgi:hypothetical protein
MWKNHKFVKYDSSLHVQLNVHEKPSTSVESNKNDGNYKTIGIQNEINGVDVQKTSASEEVKVKIC